MITLKNLVKKYNPGMENEVVALGGINLAIKDGEIITFTPIKVAKKRAMEI